MKKNKPVMYYGKVISTTSEQTIELGEINKMCEINIEIPLTWEIENFLLGRDKLQ